MLGWYKKGKNNQSLAKKYFFPVNICYQYSLHALAISIHEKTFIFSKTRLISLPNNSFSEGV